MMNPSIIPTPLRRLPWSLLLPVFGIALFGLIVLYSAAGGSMSPWAQSQGIKLVAFSGLAIALSYVRMDTWRSLSFPFYVIFLILLILVELLGAVKGGSQRWLDLGFIRLQPSEMMKLAIVLATARFYDLLPAGQIRTWSAIWPAGLMIAVPTGLVMLQPDLGTSLMIVAGGITVMFLAGLPLWLFVSGVGAIAVIAPMAFFFMLHDYQRRRVLTFLDPESDPLGSGYHISQSKIAIGSGGITGKGFLNGSQSHLDYLPEGHTDFIFATMAEEWGLIGGIILIALFIYVTRWCLRVAQNSRRKFDRLIAGGLSMTIFFYVAINISMVMGLAPVVGIPLPLFSFGGSAVMTVMICLGIIMAINRENNRSRGTFD